MTQQAVTNLDPIAALVQAYEQAQAEADKWAKAADTLKKRIQEAMGDATEGLIGGNIAFTWRHTGPFNARRFTADHPDLALKYTRTVTRDELDVDALRAEHPELFTAYRSRRFERKGVA